MNFIFQLLWKSILALILLSLIYLVNVDRVHQTTPKEALKWSPKRWTKEEILEGIEEEKKDPTTTKDILPPQTGRRYIVVGGNGLVGGWIILQLLSRGESPHSIRIIDNRAPNRKDLLSPPASKVPFHPADIRSFDSTLAAFTAPWPRKASQSQPITVFHLAATIRHWERHPDLLSLSTNVNVAGTANVLSASKTIGATIFVATSSASVCIRTTNLFKCIPFFQPMPKDYCQIYRDGDENLPKKHYDFFGNYAVSKLEAERLVRGADEKSGTFRTGVLRPGNAVYGSGGDYMSSGYLSRNVSPVWIPNIISSFTYAENAAYAHLLYEKCLIAHSNHDPTQPDIGGQSFLIADPNPPISYGDFYDAIAILSHYRCSFPIVPQFLMYFVALLIESWYLTQTLVVSKILGMLEWLGLSALVKQLGSWEWYKLKGIEINLQPSVFNLTSVNMWIDDERAKRSVEEGGLGYKPAFSTLRALCKTGLLYERDREEMGKGGGEGVGFGIRSGVVVRPDGGKLGS